MVRRLVEQQGLIAGEEDSRQLYPSPLTAGERPQWLRQDPLLESEGVRDGRRLRLCGVAPRCFEVDLEPRVLRHGLLAHAVLVARHPLLGTRPATHDLVETTGREDAVAGKDLEVPGARVLG